MAGCRRHSCDRESLLFIHFTHTWQGGIFNHGFLLLVAGTRTSDGAENAMMTEMRLQVPLISWVVDVLQNGGDISVESILSNAHRLASPFEWY
jgi:hypothetical protein